MSSVVCFLGVFWLSRFFETWAWTLNQSIHGFFKFLPKIHQHTDTPHPSTEQNIKTALSFEQICSYFPHGHQVELARRRAAARKAKLKAREKAPVVEGKWEKEEDFFTGQEHIPIMNKGEASHVFFRWTLTGERRCKELFWDEMQFYSQRDLGHKKRDTATAGS